MNLQEVFDKIHAATRKQKVKSQDIQGSCAFVGETGERCFLGMLLTEEQAQTADFECWDAFRVADELDLASHERVVLQALMEIHDNSDPTTWDTRLAELAGRHGVVYPPRAA